MASKMVMAAFVAVALMKAVFNFAGVEVEVDQSPRMVGQEVAR